MRDDEQQIFQHKPFFGQRLGSVKPARYPDRHPKTGERFFHHHPDGSFTNQNSDKEDQVMAFTSIEDLKKRRPDLYQEILEEGRNKGFEVGEALGKEMVAKARAEERAAAEAAAAAEVQRLRSIEEANRFEARVAKLRAEGLSCGAAICRVAMEDPKSHQDYLERVQAGEAGSLG